MGNKIVLRNILFYTFIFAYGVALIFLSYKLNIWEDESYSLHTTSNNLANVIRLSYNFEGQPPLYFLLLAIWRYINSGIFFARLLSIVFIGSSAIFFYKLVRMASGIESSRWMLILFLLNPFTVWTALEIRLYSLVVFLSTILLYYFFRFYNENKNKDLYLFLFISLIGLYTQYFFAFEIFALAMSILIFKGWSSFFRICVYLIPVVVLFIPNLFFVLSQVEMIQVEKSKLTIIGDVLHTPQALILGLGLENVPLTNIIATRTPRITFILISIYAYYKFYKKQQLFPDKYFERINLILLISGITILLYVLFIPIMNLGFQPRYLAIMLPMFLLIFTLFKQYSLAARKFIFITLSLYYLFTLILIYKTPLKRYDFNSASDFVNKIEHPKEPILLYNKVLLPPFFYYYKGKNSLISLPPIKYDNNYYEENITDTLGLKLAIGKIYSPTKSYLLITGNIDGFKYRVNMDQQMLDDCLKSNYNIISDTSISGYSPKYTLRIRRLEMKGL